MERLIVAYAVLLPVFGIMMGVIIYLGIRSGAGRCMSARAGQPCC